MLLYLKRFQDWGFDLLRTHMTACAGRYGTVRYGTGQAVLDTYRYRSIDIFLLPLLLPPLSPAPAPRSGRHVVLSTRLSLSVSLSVSVCLCLSLLSWLLLAACHRPRPRFPNAGSSCLAGPAVPGQLTRRFGGGATFGGAQSGAEAQLLSLQEAWKLGRLVAIRAIRGQLLPSWLLRNDSRALGPEGSDDWEKRALEHMGGAIWSSLEQFGWDHLGSPGISEGLQDSGSWGQLGDPRRLPACPCVLWSCFWSCFHPPSAPRASFFRLCQKRPAATRRAG